jgi:hypothetical protein
MRNLLLLLLFLSNICFGQKQVNYIGFNSATSNLEIAFLQGNWRIDKLIVNNTTNEYVLYPQNLNQVGFSYGNSISINSDETFVSSYSAPCGNDCFTTSMGKYKMIDENYLCFFLEQVTKSGDCIGKTTPNIDLGLYRIYKEENKIILRKSNGNPEQDKKNIQYIDMLSTKYKDISSFFEIQTFINWTTTKKMDEINEIADFCMTQNQIKDYEILYDRNFDRNYNLILVKFQNKFHYIIYRGQDANTMKVALFDDDFFENAENLVLKIDNDKSLKSITINDDYESWRNALSKNTIIIYKKKDEIRKIIYNHYNRENRYFKEIFYLKDNKPTIIKIETPGGEKFSYYIFDWKNMNGAVMKPIFQNWSFSGVMQYYHQFMKVIEKHEVNK